MGGNNHHNRPPPLLILSTLFLAIHPPTHTLLSGQNEKKFTVLFRTRRSNPINLLLNDLLPSSVPTRWWRMGFQNNESVTGSNGEETFRISLGSTKDLTYLSPKLSEATTYTIPSSVGRETKNGRPFRMNAKMASNSAIHGINLGFRSTPC